MCLVQRAPTRNTDLAIKTMPTRMYKLMSLEAERTEREQIKTETANSTSCRKF